jgi:hypothetical protein
MISRRGMSCRTFVLVHSNDKEYVNVRSSSGLVVLLT